MSSSREIDVAGARQRVAQVAVRTPLVPSPALTERAGIDVHLKLETVQPTGAFKVRGAASAILSADVGDAGVVTASTGNHGRAVAYVAHRIGIPATVCLSRGVPVGKVAALEALGAEVVVVGESQSDAIDRAHQIVADTGAVFVHPFDDPAVIAGQGTIGIEIIEDLPEVDSVLIPLSGGGLFAGIARGMTDDVRLVGVSMERAPTMAASLAAGHPVEIEEQATLADSLRGGIGLDNRYTFRIVRSNIDEVVLVSESQIWEAMRFCLHEHRLVVEGAAAVGVAAIVSGKVSLGGPAVVVVSGANAEAGHIRDLASGAPPPG